MTPYTMPTEAQDRERERIDHAALEAFAGLRSLPDGESRSVYVRRTAKAEYVVRGIKNRPYRLPAVMVEVGTYTSAIDPDALREDIEFAVRQL